MVILSVFLFSGLSFAGVSANELKGEWSLAGVSSTATAKVEPWQYTPMSWKFLNKNEMILKTGYIESNFTYSIEGNDIKMTIMDVTTTYAVEQITINSMVWHNPAMNNYYHLKKIQ